MSVVAVVGLGYVGLPLAVEFGKRRETIGLDLSAEKIASYKRFIDPTGELPSSELEAAKHLTVTTDPKELANADYIIVAVPTPVDIAHQPDFSPLIGASTSVGKYLKKGAIVVYESTVYPGATEEVCIPVLEKHSGLKWMKDFHVGYSPERINPGDKEHTLTKILKIVSGDDAETLEKVAQLYESIIVAGVHRASSIKVAEAAKVIENTQRDLNIALMNELALIFDRIGIDTMEVLKAAGTKWNFLPFRPGLVGGHCIGVDPYYLSHRAEALGLDPRVILAGRETNDSMAAWVAGQLHAARGGKPGSALVLGLTFKENVPDLRNSKVADLIGELTALGHTVTVHDPHADPAEAKHEYGLELTGELFQPHDLVLLAVPHRDYLAMGAGTLRKLVAPGGTLADLKGELGSAADWSL